jgi:hypothetical protein
VKGGDLFRLQLSFLAIALFLSVTVSAQTAIDARGNVGGSGIDGGSIIPGADTEACNGGKAGAIRWNSSTSCTEFCNGTDWTCPKVCESPNAPVWVTAAGTIDTVNENIGVYAQLDATDELGTPNFQKIAGPAWLSVSSAGAVSGKATGGTGTFPITVRATDCAGNSVDRSFDVVVNAWSGPAGCINPGQVCPDGTLYVGKSPDGDVNFFTTQANVDSNRDGNFDGAADGFSFNGGTNGNWVDVPGLTNCTGVESSCRTGESNTNTLVSVDSNSSGSVEEVHEAALACYCLGETHANAPDAIVPSECSSDPVGTNGTEGHGYDDWYLPSIAELDTMFVNLISPGDMDNPTYQDGVNQNDGTLSTVNDGPAAGSFVISGPGIKFFHSSSEESASRQWLLDSGVGRYYTDWLIKDSLNYIRCVRK